MLGQILKSAENRNPKCGHTVHDIQYCVDKVYGDTLCVDCMRKRAMTIKTSSIAAYNWWFNKNKENPDVDLGEQVRVSEVNPYLSQKESLKLAFTDYEDTPELFNVNLIPTISKTSTVHGKSSTYNPLKSMFATCSKSADIVTVSYNNSDYVINSSAETSMISQLPRLLNAWVHDCRDLSNKALSDSRKLLVDSIGTNASNDIHKMSQLSIYPRDCYLYDRKLPEEFILTSVDKIAGEIRKLPEGTSSLLINLLPGKLISSTKTAQTQTATPIEDSVYIEKLVGEISKSTTMVVCELNDVKWSGTAWRITDEYWATCAHVANIDNKPHVNFKDTSIGLLSITNEYIPCTIAYINYDIDAALLYVSDSTGYGPPLSVGDSDHLVAGQKVVTVGAPEGIADITSVGYIASAPKSITEIQTQIIFVDIDIHPGSSGGPLVNLNGDVVGIARGSHGSGSTEGDLGLNYCVPINPIVSWLDMRGLRLIPKGE